ncbi:MAG: hypothetical protein ABIS01_00735, partial [Ferruginibacter sp.]
AIQKSIMIVKQKISNTSNERDLKKIATDYGIEMKPQNKFENSLASVKQFSIGRSVINYSELTARDITISGINIEYAPSYYAAFAAGKIDYQFYDFFNKNSRSVGQYLVLGRAGTGNPEKRALILTVFQGKKNGGKYSVTDTFSNQVNIIGYSIESIFKKDDNTSMSFEIAKSTRPVAGSIQSNKQINALWKFNDETNLGISIKAQAILRKTNTKLEGFYRKTGENFQSFSLFSYNTNQTAWLARADQYLFKDKLAITGMLRRNDFTNPFTDKTYKTSTVFKSVILNVRIPKYPSLSLGFYPGSQSYVVNADKIKENAYYILNGSLVYSYFCKGIGMNSTMVYNQYFNKATDSGFVTYKGASYYIMQSILLNNLQLRGNYSYDKQPELEYYTMEASGDYVLKQNLKIGAGIKYNKINAGKQYWGQRWQLSTNMRHFGCFQFQYEKSYLPTVIHSLYRVEMGRVSWYKYF